MDLFSFNSSYPRRAWSLASVVALITLVVYIPSVGNGFVNLDDMDYVCENANIQHFNFNSLKWMLTAFHSDNWHPLTWFSHSIDYAIWGLNPAGHHLTGVILHALNTFLVVILVVTLIGMEERQGNSIMPYREGASDADSGINPLIAGMFTGLLFGLHPLHVESVAWISERKDVLCALFFLLSCLCYIKYAGSDAKKRTNYLLSLLFFLFALMSKPMAVTLPIVLVILDLYPLKRLELHSGIKAQKLVLTEKLPFFVLSIAASVLVILAQHTAIGTYEKYPLSNRMINGISAPISYIGKMLWPTNLAPLYPYPAEISFFQLKYLASFSLVIIIIVLCIYPWKARKLWAVVWVYYFVTLLPVLGIVQVGVQAAADRYTYLPSVGPFLLFGLVVGSLFKKPVKDKKVLVRYLNILILILLLVFPLIKITSKQVRIWEDSVSLWSRELEVFPDSYRAYRLRGKAYMAAGEYLKAIEDLNSALKLKPLYAEAYINRSDAYTELGNHLKAKEDYDLGVKIFLSSKGW